MTSTSTYSDRDEASAVERPQAQSEEASPPSQNAVVEEQNGHDASVAPVRSTILHGAEPAAGQVRVAMTQLSLRQIEGHATRDLTRELGGVLLGAHGHDERGHFVKVKATLPVRTADHGPVHFTFTADSWAKLHEERSQRYPELDIVGWYHTHPNLGVFYSADDVVVHKAAFVMPWQVGLVYDPVRGEGCLVGWRQTDEPADEPDAESIPLGTEPGPDLAEIDGYYELLDEQIGSVVTWQFLRSNVWREGAYPSEALLPRAGQIYAPSNAWPALPPISPWWGVMLGGVSLLLVLLLLIDRLLASSG